MTGKRESKAIAEVHETFESWRSRWHGQPIAYSLRPMTAALCYDRVIAPHSVLGGSGGLRAMAEHLQYGMWLEAKGAPRDRFEGRVMLSGWRLGRRADQLLELATVVDSTITYEKQLSEIEELTGGLVIPVLDASADYDQTFKKGNRDVLVASLVELDVVDEHELSWDQVLEFRRDQDASTKYRRLLLWLNAQLVGMSETEVIELLNQKLDDYTWALKKHGIKTALGTVSETLDGKYLLGVSAVVAASAAAGFPVLGMFAGAGVAVGRVLLRVASDRLEFKDRERGENSEVAWLYQVRKRLGT